MPICENVKIPTRFPRVPLVSSVGSSKIRDSVTAVGASAATKMCPVSRGPSSVFDRPTARADGPRTAARPTSRAPSRRGPVQLVRSAAWWPISTLASS